MARQDHRPYHRAEHYGDVLNPDFDFQRYLETMQHAAMHVSHALGSDTARLNDLDDRVINA